MFVECSSSLISTFSRKYLRWLAKRFSHLHRWRKRQRQVDVAEDSHGRLCANERFAARQSPHKHRLLFPASRRRCRRQFLIVSTVLSVCLQLEMECSSLELCQQRFPGSPVCASTGDIFLSIISGQNQEEYRASLGRFGLSGDIVFQSIETLSGGQKSRLAFALLGLQK